jgi:hypothetical protein
MSGARDDAQRHSTRCGVTTSHDILDERRLDVIPMAQEDGEDGGKRLFQWTGESQMRHGLDRRQVMSGLGLPQHRLYRQCLAGQGGGRL